MQNTDFGIFALSSQRSAQPLAADAASLIEHETLASGSLF
jgi:hypothetical protein